MPAPDDQAALSALKGTQELIGDAFERALHDEIGAPMIRVMNAMVRALHPGDNDAEVHKKMHLMMLSFLMAKRC
jgi:hypothetical protein